MGLLTCKTVSRITYTVLVETVNTAQSINQPIEAHASSRTSYYCRWLAFETRHLLENLWYRAPWCV